MGKKWVSSVIFLKKNAECSEIYPKESVYTNFEIINTGYPGKLGQEVRIKKFNYYNQKFTYRTLYVFLCL
jgi:hypothetical protein